MGEVLVEDCFELESALNCGDVNLATQAAQRLAENKSKVMVQLSCNASNRHLEKPISINICIENRLSADTCIPLKVVPTITFQSLSGLMYQRFQFPMQVQRWIVKNQKSISNDKLNHSLSSYGIQDGDTVHLYLLSASNVGVTRDMALEYYMKTFNLTAPESSTSARTESDSSVPSLETVNTSGSSGSLSERSRKEIDTPADKVGWPCPKCTFINEPTRPGCGQCGESRPDDYQAPADYVPSEAEQLRLTREQASLRYLEAERQANKEKILFLDQQPFVANAESFECRICFEEIAPGDGVVLRDCLHTFCKDCLRGQIEVATSTAVSCPFNDGTFSCDSVMQEREIRALVSDEEFSKLLALSVQEAESREKHSFHCRTTDCPGWCIYEDDVNTFQCRVCSVVNCLTCKAQHVNETCRQYQDGLKARSAVNKQAKQTQKKIDGMLRKGNAMHCPTCKIVVMKKDGCDWIRCSMCKTQICWVTKGPRWGPAGEGDVSGGCRCGVNGKLCHPKCLNCH